MRIVRERGCQVAQVATLDVDRWATAWAATSVAPGGGRPVSPLPLVCSSPFPPTTTNTTRRLLSSPENSKRPFHFGPPSPGRLTPGTHVTHSLGSLAIIAYIARSPLLLLLLRRRNANWCTPITCTHDHACGVYVYVYMCVCIQRGNEITRETRGWKKEKKRKCMDIYREYKVAGSRHLTWIAPGR